MASACGLDIAVLVVAGILIGRAVDGAMHSAPYGMLVGLFVGLGGGLYTAYRIMAPFIRTL